MTYIIGMVSQKGGVGKSTLARMMAREIADGGMTVKIADLDTQQQTCTYWAGRRAENGILPEIQVQSFAGIKTSIYGYYFWPTTGDGFLLNTIASVFLGGTSVFGGTGSVVGTFVAAYIIGAINAGIVSAGINAFYTQLAFGFVIVISVVLQIVIERRIRRQSLTGR